MTPQPLDFDPRTGDDTLPITAGLSPTPEATLRAELDALAATLPADDEEAVNERTAQLCSSLKPCNTFEMGLTEDLALNEIRARRFQIQIVMHRKLAARRAEACWDDERRIEAEELMLELARRPAVVSRKLQRTKQGCDALLERWRGLEQIWNVKRAWTDEQRSLTLDMLGVSSELREGTAALDDPNALTRREIARLERLQAATRNDLDDAERALVAQEAGTPDAAVALLMRLEAACHRRIQWARKQFKTGRHDYEPWASSPARPAPARRREAAPPTGETATHGHPASTGRAGETPPDRNGDAHPLRR